MKYFTFLKTRSGEVIPSFKDSDGGEKPLHSTIDPVKEAQKLLTTVGQDTRFLVFLGLGGGFAPLEALKNDSTYVVVIDFNKDAVGELLSSKDYSKLLNNKRFTLLTDSSFDEIKNLITERYNPSLYGGIKVLPLRTRTDRDSGLFQSAADAIQQAIETISGDYTVQAHFGKRWFNNIIRNLIFQNHDESYQNFAQNINETAIVAAGPSLDNSMARLAEQKENGAFIICCDTALGSLLYNGIKPDAVVSIDCQHISVFHFMGNNLRGIPLVLDIASPPLLSSIFSIPGSPSPLFFSSGHPLARYISAYWKPFLQLDTSGGNVTYACLSLAQELGAKKITLFGADFAYTGNSTYARGTYVIPYFEIRQNRFLTLEAQSSRFLYRSAFLPRAPGQTTRETAQLKFYRERLREKLENKPQGRFCEAAKKNSFTDSAGEFLEQYRNDIAALPAGELDEKQKQIFTTLLPYAAFIKHRNKELKTSELIEETKKCCITEINKIIN